tara:strand:- start:64 stop:288 length:225 start_codon:yes stop_codon:yes gene_type:complete
MIDSPAARTDDFLATTLGLRAHLNTPVGSDKYLISPSHSLIRTFSVSNSLPLPGLAIGFGLYLSVTSDFGSSFC